MKAERSSVSSEDNKNGPQNKENAYPPEPSDGSTTCNKVQEQGSTSAALQHKISQENPEISTKRAKQPTSADQDHHVKCSSSSSSLHHSNAPLPRAKAVDNTNQLLKVRLRKTFPRDADIEWTFYPSSCDHTYHAGKKCLFDGVHLRNKTTSSERTLEMRIGKKKYEIDPRNGIPVVTFGDHPYACPEQSTNFHKIGSTRPLVNFGSAIYQKKSDTFIPLQHLPLVPSVPFCVREKHQDLAKERMEVKNLEFWKPAQPLLQSLLSTGITQKLTFQQF